MSDIELLNSATNAVVARHVEREFPGVLLQGDTLKIIFDDLEELIEDLDAKDIDSAKGISEGLKEMFVDLLSHYESVLAENNIVLPYSKSVNS